MSKQNDKVNPLLKQHGPSAPAGSGMAGAGTGTSGNIQGNLHLGGFLGGDSENRKKKKKRKEAIKYLEKADYSTLYVSRVVENAPQIIAWAKTQGFETTLRPEDMHATVAFSKQPVDWQTLDDDDGRLSIPPSDDTANDRTVEKFGEAAVLRFESAELSQRWLDFINFGASWDHPGYNPHITISWNAQNIDVTKVVPYRGPIVLGPEVFAPINEDWKDTIVEKTDNDLFKQWQATMDDISKRGARNSKTDQEKLDAAHDALVAAGARCNGHDKVEKLDNAELRIAKIDDEHGIVFGYAIICNKNGAPYYDLNVDLSTSQRVPEHIPEGAMLKAAVDFMSGARPGNEMHGGADAGQYLFAFPLTTDIAKAMNINTPVTGLMVGFKPTPELLAKFKDGTYKGFSIEGRRVKVSEFED